MQVEVDQSGKIGNTGEDTILAYSNSDSFSVLIPKQVKRECLLHLRERGLPPNTIYYRMFGIGLYFLLRQRIGGMSRVIIDIEYPKHESRICRHLLNLLGRDGISVQAEQIRFGFIGKKSNAHRVGLDTFRGKRRATITLSVEDILWGFGEE